MKQKQSGRHSSSRPRRVRIPPPEKGRLTTADSISIKEIARRATVSIGTVDRVVHNRGRVSTSTETKVRRIIEETGYRPNMFASRLSRAKVFRFGVLMPNPHQDNGFWQLPLRGIERAEGELRSQRIQIVYYFFDKFDTSQKAIHHLSQRILHDALDGLLAAPVAPHWMKDFLLGLPASCPYVLFDSSLPDSTPLSSIIQNSFQSGVLAARLADLLATGAGKIAIMQIAPSDFHLLERARGFRSYFKRKSGITCLECVIKGARIDASFQQAFGRLLESHPDLKGVFVTNAATYKAAEFLQHRPGDRRIHVIGYDLIPDNIRYIKEGWIDFLINQRPKTQGYQGIYTLYRRLVLDEKINDSILMPIDIITRENISYYESSDEEKEKIR
jgi:LacI family transcriptional regulator